MEYLEKVAPLDHKVFDDAVERAALVPRRCLVLPTGDTPVRQGTAQPEFRKRIARLYSPVQNWRKFSAVLGHMSLNSSIFILPASTPPIVTSKNTTGFSGLV